MHLCLLQKKKIDGGYGGPGTPLQEKSEVASPAPWLTEAGMLNTRPGKVWCKA
jgi:hypothetical protein